MYKRLELHNHTNESDASITCQELIDLMSEEGVDAFAITDHNTISGHTKIKQLLEEKKSPVSCIYGMEYTTYYGHILCLNLKEYVPWENINLHKPELLFQAAKEKGALTGIAHPFSFGWPFAQGCRFEMNMTDYSSCDFIEIFNNPEPLHQVNEPALLLWEKLVLDGNKLAITCGMDLHGKSSFHGHYATYIEKQDGMDIEKELEMAIHCQKTWVSKGPILQTTIKNNNLCFSLYQTNKPGYIIPLKEDYLISLQSKDCKFLCRLTEEIPLSLFGKNSPIIIKLYEKADKIENLVCICPLFQKHLDRAYRG